MPGQPSNWDFRFPFVPLSFLLAMKASDGRRNRVTRDRTYVGMETGLCQDSDRFIVS